MNKPSRAERLRYAFDNFMARGTIALILGLFVVAAIGVDPRHASSSAILFRNDGTDLRPALEQPDAHARPGHDGRRHGLVRVPARDAGRHPLRDLHHQRPHRHHQHRHRGQARRAAQGPLARRRAATPSSSAGRRRSSRSSPSWSSANANQAEERDRHPGRPRQGRDGGRDPRRACRHRPDLGRLPHGQPDRHRRPRDRPARDLARDRHPVARDRRPRRRRHQDDAGDHQPPAPPARAVPHRGRDPRPDEPGRRPRWSAATRPS